MAGKEGNVEDRIRRGSGLPSRRVGGSASAGILDGPISPVGRSYRGPTCTLTNSSTKTGSSRLDAHGGGNPQWFAKTAKTSCACLSVDALVSNLTNFPSLNRYA
jgi:hypothetical protein